MSNWRWGWMCLGYIFTERCWRMRTKRRTQPVGIIVSQLDSGITTAATAAAWISSLVYGKTTSGRVEQGKKPTNTEEDVQLTEYTYILLQPFRAKHNLPVSEKLALCHPIDLQGSSYLLNQLFSCLIFRIKLIGRSLTRVHDTDCSVRITFEINCVFHPVIPNIQDPISPILVVIPESYYFLFSSLE